MIYELVSIFDSLLGGHKQFPGNEYYYFCPFCHHHNPKLAVNLEKKKWQCWKCNSGGRTLLSLLKRLDVSYDQIQKLATLLQEEVPRYKQEKDVDVVLSLPREYKPLWEPSPRISYMRALNYVKKRGITMDDIIRHQIGYCDDGMYVDRIIFPSYDAKGVLNYFVGRALDPEALNYLTPSISKNLVGFEYHINWKHPIVIVEGAFDAVAVKRNAIPLFGKIIPNILRKRIIEHNVQDIYIALDGDALKTTVRLAEEFMCDGKNVYIVKMGGNDPSVLGFTEMQRRIRQSVKLNFLMLTQLKLQLA